MRKKEDRSFEISFFESILRRDPHYTTVIELLGGLYTEAGRIGDGLKMDRKLVRMMPDNATAHYNLACSLALSRRKAEALKTLRHAVDLGYADADWMRKDPDLESLRQHPTYQALLQQLKAAASGT